MTLLHPKFAWFSHTLDGNVLKVGIYKDGVLITLTNVAHLDARDSAAFLEAQKKLEHSATGNYEAEMQNILRAYYAKVIRPIPLPASF